MNKSAVLLLAIVACVFYVADADFIKVNQCQKRTAADIESLSITGCTTYPCALKKGTDAAIEMKFTLKRRVNELGLRIAGRINGREIPFSVDDTNHCQNTIEGITDKCNLSKGETYTYKYSMPILNEYPSLMVVVKFEIVDKRGNPVACFTFPARIEE